MKLNLFFSTAIAVITSVNSFAQSVDAYGYTTVNVDMKPGYTERVFFNFDKGETINKPADNWDVAFYRANVFNIGTRVNDYKNIIVYEVSQDPTQWDNITNPTTAISGKTALYNSDITDKLQDGAFDQVNWWSYNHSNHIVSGKSIFIIRYVDKSDSKNDVYRKFMIESRFKNYKIKYAIWSPTKLIWGDTKTATIEDGNTDKLFNYFEFKNNKVITDNEPDQSQWDFVFTQYIESQINYKVTGVLQNSTIKVAKKTGETQATINFPKPANTDYSSSISTIGREWKVLNFLGYAVQPDWVFYVQKGTSYYRMYFTKATGSSSGTFQFKYKDVTDILEVEEVGSKANFGVYPNPTTDKKATILFEVKEKANNKGTAELFDFSGKKVYQTNLQNQNGLYEQEINLQGLPAGTYLLKISYGGATQTKKLIVK